MPIIKKTNNIQYWQGYGKFRAHCLCDCKMKQTCGKHFGIEKLQEKDSIFSLALGPEK
jgi:hypothetical protein